MAQNNNKRNEKNGVPVVQRNAEPTTVICLSNKQGKQSYSLLVFWIFIAVVILGTLVLLIGGTLSFYAYYQGSSRIIPGVYIGQTNIGSMTKADATDFLRKYWDTETQIEISDGFETETFMAYELGYSIDAEASIQKALNIAHGHPCSLN